MILKLFAVPLFPIILVSLAGCITFAIDRRTNQERGWLLVGMFIASTATFYQIVKDKKS